MDALDVRIIRAMGIRPYDRRAKPPEALKPSNIAGAVDASVVTVKERIARMEDVGVIAGYQIFPNLRHLDLGARGYFLRIRTEDGKRNAVDAMAGLAGLIELHDFLGDGVCADFAFQGPDELAEKLAFLSEKSGDASPRRFYDRHMPVVKRRLSALDWRILRALRGRARRPLAEVAEAVGVSGRTVKRRYAMMAREGSFFVVPLLNPAKAEGLILFELLFYLRDPASTATTNAILRAFDEHRVYTYRPASPELGTLDMLLFAKSSEEVERLRRQGGAIPGVAKAEAWLFQGFFDHSAWIDDAIDIRAGRR
ncbi:MAG TPA: Lrp/AsnC family transcriptional regulator [Candidatus Thermoplasmatota archaeon]|nr:Lrp/AsnC family transcriptional regulator [Candidatus Thermoplasmatota archaeon]